MNRSPAIQPIQKIRRKRRGISFNIVLLSVNRPKHKGEKAKDQKDKESPFKGPVPILPGRLVAYPQMSCPL